MSEFVKSDVKKLREYIKNAVMQGDNSEILYEIGNDRIKPSKKSLQDVIVGMLESSPEFNLIDDQKVVFERIMEQSRLCEKEGKSARSQQKAVPERKNREVKLYRH